MPKSGMQRINVAWLVKKGHAEDRENHAWRNKRERSYGFLDAHKGSISDSAYDRIKRTIGSQAIEDMFVSKESIYDMVRIEKGETTARDVIDEYKKRWGC